MVGELGGAVMSSVNTARAYHTGVLSPVEVTRARLRRLFSDWHADTHDLN